MSGDISFLISRLSADGYKIDEEAMINQYCRSAERRGSGIQPQEIEIQMCLSNLNTSFRFWHVYLHDSTAERVAGIYEKMLTDAKILLKEL